MVTSITETGGCVKGECPLDPAESKNPSERGSFMDENREIPGSSGRIAPGPAGKGKSVHACVNETGKSDCAHSTDEASERRR